MPMPLALDADLLDLVAAARAAAAEDPFANPALAVALALSRRIDDGAISHADLAAVNKLSPSCRRRPPSS